MSPRTEELPLPLAGEGGGEGCRRAWNRHTFATNPHPNPLPQAGEGAIRWSRRPLP